MFNVIISDNTKSIMIKTGKTIDKDAEKDMQTHLISSENAVYNITAFLRGNFIVYILI